MKRLIENEEGGFVSMLGKHISLFCGIYIYTGVLAGVNDDHLELDEAKVVYETGHLSDGEWETVQALPGVWRVMIQSVESWGSAKCE